MEIVSFAIAARTAAASANRVMPSVLSVMSAGVSAAKLLVSNWAISYQCPAPPPADATSSQRFAVRRLPKRISTCRHRQRRGDSRQDGIVNFVRADGVIVNVMASDGVRGQGIVIDGLSAEHARYERVVSDHRRG